MFKMNENTYSGDVDPRTSIALDPSPLGALSGLAC